MSEPGTPPVVGVIGGSGVYDIEGLTNPRWETVETPFGPPSDALLCGEIEGQPVVFLPRHGRGHQVPPNRLNFRANIDALKQLGVTEVLSLSAVGSLREDLEPGTFVLADQFIDRTVGRERSFFDTGLVAHVSAADPTCTRVMGVLEDAAKAEHIPISHGGTYLVMEGPQFSSRAESFLYRSWGCDLVGMTNMPEAKLAREAELCYATVAMVTDYDCWHDEHGNVSVEQVIKVLTENAEKARRLVARAVPALAGRTRACAAGCNTALDTAVVTKPEARDPAMIDRLKTVAGRVL
ncbi:methylthioadenosine phosphorylase [Limimonas halophila]|uniref:S-methyl-5'-thioadenosine phosphorylase n=1 Tax=Limimonas halophila TaxID=1082479 RepID=A0A1G7LD17_9PROT|nr:S-methyl-5'-thioadenosine phosphorylase [Limimonas halophila]SDF47204.1 methylthioadenosine phosphorylase [Limimonas halophila]